MNANLIAHNSDGDRVENGSVIFDFRGNRHILIECVRMNEFRYGGGRSGQVKVRDMDGFESIYYDKVFNLEVWDTEREFKACSDWIKGSMKFGKEDSEKNSKGDSE